MTTVELICCIVGGVVLSVVALIHEKRKIERETPEQRRARMERERLKKLRQKKEEEEIDWYWDDYYE